MDVAPNPAVYHQLEFTQRHQVLGQICLPPAKHRLQVADARFPGADRQQDLQAGRMPDHLEQF